jgi:hypothetical protein
MIHNLHQNQRNKLQKIQKEKLKLNAINVKVAVSKRVGIVMEKVRLNVKVVMELE